MSALKLIETVRNEFLAELEDVGEDLNQIENFRSTYLGRKGKVASLFSLMGKASNEDRPALGNSLNELKTDLTTLFENKVAEINSSRQKTQDDSIDLSLPSKEQRLGSIHILEQTLSEIKEIYKSIGFHVAYGPEVDDDYRGQHTTMSHGTSSIRDMFSSSPSVALIVFIMHTTISQQSVSNQ